MAMGLEAIKILIPTINNFLIIYRYLKKNYKGELHHNNSPLYFNISLLTQTLSILFYTLYLKLPLKSLIGIINSGIPATYGAISYC